MRQIRFRWGVVFLALIAITNFTAYKYGGYRESIKNSLGEVTEEDASSDDEDVVIIVARPEKKSQGDDLDEQFFRAHIVKKGTSYLGVGKANLFKYRGQMFSRKPLDEGQRMFIGLLQ